MALQEQQQAVVQFLRSGGTFDPVDVAKPRHDVLHALAGELTGVPIDTPGSPASHIKIFNTVSTDVERGLGPAFMDEVSGKALANTEFSNVTTHKLGAMTLRIINIARQSTRYRKTNELVGAANRLVLVTEPIDIAQNVQSLGIVYGESSAQSEWMGDSHTIAAAEAVTGEQVYELEKRLDAAFDTEVSIVWPDLTGSRPEDVVSYDALSESADVSQKALEEHIRQFVSDIVATSHDEYNQVIEKEARRLATARGGTVEAERRWLDNLPANIDVLHESVERYLGIVEAETFQELRGGEPLVVLMPNDAITYLADQYPDSIQPDILGRNHLTGAEILNYGNRMVITAPSPLGSHKYLGVYAYSSLTK